MLRLTLLGGFELADDDRRVVLTAKKPRALLAFLALAPGPAHPRDKLATLLWADSGDSQARNSLRQAIAELRRALPGNDPFITQGDSLALDPERITVDVLELEQAIREDSPESLERVLALYRGELLEGLNARAPELEDWLMGERVRLQELTIGALERLLAHHDRSGSRECAVRAAIRLVSLDPLREPVHRTLMKLYASQGRTAAALKQYRTCRAALQRELGVEPEAETERIFERIKARREQAGEDEAASNHAPADHAPVDPGQPVLRQATVLAVEFPPMPSSDAHDAERAHTRATRRLHATERAVRGYGGTLTERGCERAMAVFGIPTARDNDAERAVRAALEIQRPVPDDAEGLTDTCIGVASGQLVVSSDDDAHDYALTGEPLGQARDLAARAEAAQTLMTDGVRTSVRGRIACESQILGPSRSDTPVWLARVGGVQNAPPTSFVGRHTERELFAATLKHCAHTGAGQSVLLRGEAGIGKTRLLDELGFIAEAHGFQVHKTFALDFGLSREQRPVRLLALSLMDVPIETPAAAPEALERLIGDGVWAEEQRVFANHLLGLANPPPLASLLDAMDSGTRMRGLRAVVGALVMAASHRQPAVLAVDDLHWADAETLAHLAEIAATVAECPAILVMTSRFEGEPLDPGWRAGTRGAPLTTLDLGPLREAEALEIAGRYDRIQAEVARRCVARAGGNPLFLDQLLTTAQRDPERIPDSVQSLVWARMDTLTPQDRRALQAAAVLGQRFNLAALRVLLDDPEYGLERLISRALVRADGEEFLFTHALVMEAVYASLLTSQRRSLHGRAAEWLALRDPVLHAEHLDRAEDPAALGAYLEAAQSEGSRYHYERALQLVGRAVELAGEGPSRFEPHRLHGELLRDSGATHESIAAFRRAFEAASDEIQQCRARIGMVAGLRVADRYAEALDLLDKTQPVAERHHRDDELAQIHYHRGGILFPLGRIEQCLAEHERARDYARQAGSPEHEARALSGLGDAWYQRGRMVSAYGQFHRCIELARRHGLRRIEVANLPMRGLTAFYQNQLDKGLEDLREAIAMAVAVGDQRGECLARIVLSVLLTQQVDWQGAQAAAEQALALSRRLGTRRFESDSLESLATAVAAQGRRARAANLLDAAYAITRESGPTYNGPWVLGSLALATDDPQRRAWALAEGEQLLSKGCVSHNYLHFYQLASEAALDDGDLAAVERYVSALEDYTRAEPLAWCDFVIARARALAAHRGGYGDAGVRDELQRLRAQAEQAGLKAEVPALEHALGAYG